MFERLGILEFVCLIAMGTGNDIPVAPEAIHPNVFELVSCWASDSEEPVVTEISLDAVFKNRNQFDFSKVKRNGDWTECPGGDGRGFRRFRVLSAADNRVVVEYQSNSGGTFTSASTIEYALGIREISKFGRPTTLRVLRVLSVASR